MANYWLGITAVIKRLDDIENNVQGYIDHCTKGNFKELHNELDELIIFLSDLEERVKAIENK